MIYRFLPAAEQDLEIAVDYYELCRPGLGEEFVQELFLTLERVLQYPNGWEKVSENSRRCLTRRFPYEIIYVVEREVLVVTAIANQRRKPGSWKKR